MNSLATRKHPCGGSTFVIVHLESTPRVQFDVNHMATVDQTRMGTLKRSCDTIPIGRSKPPLFCAGYIILVLFWVCVDDVADQPVVERTQRWNVASVSAIRTSVGTKLGHVTTVATKRLSWRTGGEKYLYCFFVAAYKFPLWFLRAPIWHVIYPT